MDGHSSTVAVSTCERSPTKIGICQLDFRVAVVAPDFETGHRLATQLNSSKAEMIFQKLSTKLHFFGLIHVGLHSATAFARGANICKRRR